jgi:uncharacterized protein
LFLSVLRLIRLGLLGLCLGVLAGPAWAQVAVPLLQSRVTDLTGTLDAATRQSLETRLGQLQQDKGSQLAVLLVPTTGPETIEQFGLRVAETWKLGRKGVDDGVLLVVAKDDRAVRIEVGYGLEGVVNDAVAKRVIEEILVPRFKAGQFGPGINDAVAALDGLIRGEPLPPPKPGWSLARLEDAGSMAMVFVFVVGGFLRAVFGPLVGGAIAGGVAFLGAWYLIGSPAIALVVGFIVFVLTLIGLSHVVGGRGGGGGGFSGGGGGFGGGGASGRW